MGPRPHLSFCTCKTACLASEILSSKGLSTHLWFLHARELLLDQNYTSLWVPDFTCRFVRKKTAWLAPEKLVSMGPSPHLWFLDAKQRLLDQNNMSLWVPALICGFWMQNSDFWTRITNLNGSQTSPVALCMQYSVICTGMTSLYWFQPSSVVLCLQNIDLRTRNAYL